MPRPEFQTSGYAAQGGSIPEDVRAIEARPYFAKAVAATFAKFSTNAAHGFPPFVANVADVAARSGSKIGCEV